MIGAVVILADPIFQGLAISLPFWVRPINGPHRSSHPGYRWALRR